MLLLREEAGLHNLASEYHETRQGFYHHYHMNYLYQQHPANLLLPMLGYVPDEQITHHNWYSL